MYNSVWICTWISLIAEFICSTCCKSQTLILNTSFSISLIIAFNSKLCCSNRCSTKDFVFFSILWIYSLSYSYYFAIEALKLSSFWLRRFSKLMLSCCYWRFTMAIYSLKSFLRPATAMFSLSSNSPLTFLNSESNLSCNLFIISEYWAISYCNLSLCSFSYWIRFSIFCVIIFSL